MPVPGGQQVRARLAIALKMGAFVRSDGGSEQRRNQVHCSELVGRSCVAWLISSLVVRFCEVAAVAFYEL